MKHTMKSHRAIVLLQSKIINIFYEQIFCKTPSKVWILIRRHITKEPVIEQIRASVYDESWDIFE